MKGAWNRALGGLLVLALCWLSPVAAVPAVAVGVVYPEVPEPYRALFHSILTGIEEGIGGRVATLPLRRDARPEVVSRWARSRGVEVVVALGRRGMDVARPLAPELPVVVGAVLLPPGEAPEGVTGVSLVPDPAALFARLREVAPMVRRVRVVHGPARRALVERARRSARRFGITLEAVEVTGRREGARRILDLTRGLRGPRHAVWLLRDGEAMDERAVLPELLRRAWDQGFVLFSSNPGHVRRGALLAVFPDSRGLGRQLAELARRVARGGRGAAGILPLAELSIALNVRTAQHLGLEVDEKLLRQADLVFPQP